MNQCSLTIAFLQIKNLCTEMLMLIMEKRKKTGHIQPHIQPHIFREKESKTEIQFYMKSFLVATSVQAASFFG